MFKFAQKKVLKLNFKLKIPRREVDASIGIDHVTVAKGDVRDVRVLETPLSPPLTDKSDLR